MSCAAAGSSFFFEVIAVEWRFCANGRLYVPLCGFLSEIADLVVFVTVLHENAVLYRS